MALAIARGIAPGDRQKHDTVSGRYRPFGRRPELTFSLAIGLPAVLLYVGGAAVVLLSLILMAAEIDRVEQQRGVTAMAAGLDGFLNTLAGAVSDEGTWNEAYLNVVVQPDPAWMDTTWGSAARLGQSFDDVMVTDQAGIIQFGENNLGSITGDITARYPAARGMLADLDRAIVQSGDAAVIAEFASDGTTPAGLAAISIHRSTPNEAAVPRHQRRILWIARHFTPSTLQEIAVRMQMPVASLVGAPQAGQSWISLRDPSGAIVGTIAWTPERPGDVAFRRAGFVAFSIYFAIGVLLLFVLGTLQRAMMKRARAIDAAFVEQAAMVTEQATAAATATAPASAAAAEPTPIDGVSATNFTVEYQPVFDLRAETMVGVETLLRWTRPDGTELLQEGLAPRDCAALMERAGILALRHASGELAPLLGVTLSLAVTPDQVMNSVFAEKIAGTLGATGFPARRLQLAVDAALLPEPERLVPHLAGLRHMGISVALGNLTLSERTADYLRPGFVDRIALAPHMVSLVDVDPVRHRLLEATIAAARAASIAVTVPNLERKEEAARLLRLGCTEFRGSLLAAPMSLAGLTALILAPARPQQVRRAG